MEYFVNPFQPSTAANRNVFIGREKNISSIYRSLIQTSKGLTQSFMVMGERGIGKTSLLLNVKDIAEGKITRNDISLNYCVIIVDLNRGASRYSLIKSIRDSFSRKLAQREKLRHYLHETWSFISRVEAAGIKLNQIKTNDSTFFEEFTYSLADTVKRITQSNRKGDSLFDGVLILLDEVDNVEDEVRLGEFIKLTLERIQREGVQNVMFGLFGLPTGRTKLMKSHPSVIRNLIELKLDPFSDSEMEVLLDRIKGYCCELNGKELIITEDAKEFLFSYSRGFPHFFHHYGYYAFEESSNCRIDFFQMQRGAMRNAINELSRVYSDDMYEDLEKIEDYRLLLQELAFELNGWLDHETLSKRYLGNTSKLQELLQILEKRRIVESDSNNSRYRLIEQGFGWWILINQYRSDEIRYFNT